ncbi:hypothetical protein NQ317_006347 [Molorchus minor]|uniref:Uncharacterized protein n=1 Tax=Molorchus minor TaxID=1323400 RepID=A0ABQ9JM96_9CUCU|nr:hypothetical protein NQ317_006347 [Molorchus minor]
MAVGLCFLTSTITATMAWSLTIPMTMLVGVLKGATYPVPFYIGIILLIIGFIAVAILSHPNWDPLFDCFGRIGLCQSNQIHIRFSEMPSEQTEALISVDGDHEA